MQANSVVQNHKKRPVGRPPRAGESANCIVRVRMTTDEIRLISDAAARAGMTVAAWLRGLALRVANHEMMEAAAAKAKEKRKTSPGSPRTG